MTRACPVCKSLVTVREDDNVITTHFAFDEICSMSGRIYKMPTLWIHIRTWERHVCGSLELRDYLRGVWSAAGHATAVER